MSFNTSYLVGRDSIKPFNKTGKRLFKACVTTCSFSPVEFAVAEIISAESSDRSVCRIWLMDDVV